MKTVLSHSDDPVSLDAAAEIVASSLAQLGGDTPKAGLLFSSVEYDQAACLKVFRQAWPDLQLIGGSSDGEISSSLGFRHDSLLLVLFAGDDLEAQACLGRNLSADPDAAVAEALSELRDFEPTLCIANFAPTANSSAIVKHLNR